MEPTPDTKPLAQRTLGELGFLNITLGDVLLGGEGASSTGFAFFFIRPILLGDMDDG